MTNKGRRFHQYILKGVFLWFLLFFVIILNAQQIRVIDVLDKTPIEGVAIYNTKKTKYVLTDNNGEADISIFKANEVLVFQNLLYKKLSLSKSQIKALNFVVTLEQNVEDLNQVVVSASKFKQRKTDVAQKIVTIDAEDIAFQNPQTSADLLETSGNVFVQKSQLGGGSPMIRGFSTNRLLIMVDGVRMNNAIFRGGNVQNVISIDPLSVQKTEITLGAGSVVYGSDAIGGVMSFYTNKPQLSYKDQLYFKVNAFTRYSSANSEVTGHLDLNFGLKKWAFYTNISVSDFDNLKMGSNGPQDYLRYQYVSRVNGADLIVDNPNPRDQVPTGYGQINLMQKAHYEPSDNLKFDFGVYFTSTTDVPRYDRLLRTNEDGSFKSAEWNYGPQQWFMANSQVTKTSSNSDFYDQLKATIAYQNFKESRETRDFQSVDRTIRAENVDAISFNLDLEKQLSPRTNLYYGLEYVYNIVGSKAQILDIETGSSNPTVTRYPNNSTWQSMAAYTSIKYKPHPEVIIQSGLRYNHVASKARFVDNNVFLNLPFSESSLSSGALTGSAGLSWLPNQIVQWKLNLSTAFRAPNIDDMGKVFDSEPGAVVVPNNKLKAEYAYGVDLGLKLNINDHISIDLGTYYTYLDNAMVRQNSTLNGEEFIFYDGELSRVQSIQNASQAWLYGFEIGALIKFTDRLSMLTQYNIIDGTEEDADGIEVPIRHVAPDFGRTHLTWKNDTLEFDVFAMYNASIAFKDMAPSEQTKPFIYAKDNNGNPYSPSWYTLNFRSAYQINSNWRLMASLENVTNQLYRPYSSGISGPGTNLVLSVKYAL